MDRALRFFLALMGGMMVAVGGAFLFAPEMVAESSGVLLPTPAAHGDVRAVFGGMELAIGVSLIASARVPAWSQAGALLGVSVGVFAGLGRLIALVADGATDPLTVGSLAADAGLAAVLFVLARRART